ncbi:MAG: hypothetical protein HZB38_02545 [Planctomycetes bacterium]|nr:hypothetical protein [Planctomycetota bacterium]
MPKETDAKRLQLLARILLGAIGRVDLARRAYEGSLAEPDDLGLYRLFSETDMGDLEIRASLRDALVAHLKRGAPVNRVDVKGDDRGDPELRYEFRFVFRETKVYVKAVLNLDDKTDPLLEIKCVKRKN